VTKPDETFQKNQVVSFQKGGDSLMNLPRKLNVNKQEIVNRECVLEQKEKVVFHCGGEIDLREIH
jgi:hypothetical protein